MNQIDISIIIATRNREQILWQTVEKACDAIENKNAEIIIVNDGDSTLDIPGLLADKIQYFDNVKKGVSSARNLGASKAKGDILFFTDDDMWINKEVIQWINSYIIFKKNTESVYIINWKYPPYLEKKLINTKVGRYLLSVNYNNLWGRMHKDSAQPPQGLYKHNSVGSGSLIMHQSTFSRVEGYNEKMIFQGEDIDLAKKLNESGVSIFVVFDIVLYHNQIDRLGINDSLQRIFEGFGSEFKAAKSGVETPVSNINYKGIKKMVFGFCRRTEKKWILILNLLPNNRFFTPLNNRILGALGGLQRYKQWRIIMKK
jgi:glycosyltransferase involved in cell wall biosynthesis